jgi:hypothetical protein
MISFLAFIFAVAAILWFFYAERKVEAEIVVAAGALPAPPPVPNNKEIGDTKDAIDKKLSCGYLYF